MQAVLCDLIPLLQQARQTISDQQQAISTLQANMAALSTRGNSTPPSLVSSSAAPEKRNLEMMPEAFRFWKRLSANAHNRRQSTTSGSTVLSAVAVRRGRQIHP